jgi:hypothetical protein
MSPQVWRGYTRRGSAASRAGCRPVSREGWCSQLHRHSGTVLLAVWLWLLAVLSCHIDCIYSNCNAAMQSSQTAQTTCAASTAATVHDGCVLHHSQFAPWQAGSLMATYQAVVVHDCTMVLLCCRHTTAGCSMCAIPVRAPPVCIKSSTKQPQQLTPSANGLAYSARL